MGHLEAGPMTQGTALHACPLSASKRHGGSGSLEAAWKVAELEDGRTEEPRMGSLCLNLT